MRIRIIANAGYDINDWAATLSAPPPTLTLQPQVQNRRAIIMCSLRFAFQDNNKVKKCHFKFANSLG